MESDADGDELKSGTVMRIVGDRAIVRIERDGEDCGGCRSCAVKALCRGRDVNRMELPVRLDSTRSVHVGDTVMIVYHAGKQGVAALVMFLPSLVGLLLGGFAAQRLFGGEGDGLFLAGAAAGLGLGLAMTFALSRLLPLGPKAIFAPARSGGPAK